MQRFAPFVASVGVLLVGALCAPGARAASAACSSTVPCAAPQVCRLSESICVFEATDPQTLIDAITAANLDAARDVIQIGPANPDGNTPDTTIPIETVVVTDPDFGPLGLPVIVAPLTIQGQSTASATLDANDDIRMFLVRPDVALDAQPDLTLKNLTIIDARPGINAAGNIVGGGAVAVTNVATSTGLLSTFSATALRVRSSGNDNLVGEAVISLAGGDAVLTNCTFEDNVGTVAGVILSSATSLRIVGGVFQGNHSDAGVGAISVSTKTDIVGGTQFLNNSGGAVGAVDATAATIDDGSGTQVAVTLTINTATLDSNRGDAAGAVRSLATTTLGGDTFRQNRANGDGASGGAVLARSLRVANGVYEDNSARANGGAVAILDVPPSDLVRIESARFSRNRATLGGAIFDVGAPISITGATLENNRSDSQGGAVYLQNLVDRNGVTTADATLSENLFRTNIADPVVGVNTGDVSLDETGADLGNVTFGITGAGSAVLIDGTGLVTATDNCFTGNAAAAVTSINNGAIAAGGNWWGAATGPGDGDVVSLAGVTTTGFLTTAPTACASSPTSGYPQLFMAATVTTDSALIGTDYHLIDHVRGLNVLNSDHGDLIPDTHTGTLNVDAIGVNDADVEGNETFTFGLAGCQGDCGYVLSGQTVIQMAITDNGNGGAEGEGEGEGDPCAEKITASPTELALADNGQPASGTITVTNDGPCGVQLFAPFVQKGASQGFSVAPILEKDRALAPGKSLVVNVTFTPPTEASAADAAAPEGLLVLETAGGSLVQVKLLLANGCACQSSGHGVPTEGVLAGTLLAALTIARRRRRASPRQAGSR